jgi:hypothetical protein
MKLIYQTFTYGGRVCVRIQYSHQVYFAGAQPPDNSLILLELPNLKSSRFDDILFWLKENADSPANSRREINEFPAGCWRQAVPDDYLDAENYSETIWQIYSFFNASEFDRFGDKWLGLAQAKLKEALAAEPGDPRIKAFDQIRQELERVYFVVDKIPYRLNLEIEEMRKKLEEARFAEIRNRTDDLRTWIETAESFKSSWSIQTALNLIAAELRNRRLSSAEIIEQLEHFGPQLRQATQYPAHPFWTNVAPLVRLEQNITGEEIDLTAASEEEVQLGWELIDGRRVGVIVPGRTALVLSLQEAAGLRKLYLNGERKLKFQIQKNGGRMEKFGCTLRLESQFETKSIQPALLEIERLDALANLDIDQALERIAHLELPNNHLVFYTAEKARSDPKQARVLADLLIELLVGVDADIARNLARAQAKGNRQ